jgi:hypothetical protein
MSSIVKFTRIKKQVKEYGRRIDRSVEKRKLLVEGLEEKFSISPKELAETIKQKKRRLDALTLEFDKKLSSFTAKYSSKLTGSE